MLMLTQLCGFGAVAIATATPPSLSYIGLTRDAGAAQNHTFNNVAIGAADATRRVVVGVITTNAVAFRTISSITCNTVSMGAAHVSVNGSAFVAGHLAFYSALVPTGTTANFQINTSGTNARMNVFVFRAINETGASPHATMSDGTQSSGVVSGTINIPSNGWLAAISTHAGTSIPSITFSGVTEASDDWVTPSAGTRSGAAFNSGMTVETGRAVSSSPDGGSNFQSGLVAISWG